MAECICDKDLDIYNIAKTIPEDQTVFYFRSGDDNWDDFVYAKGDIADMGEVLAHLMGLDENLEHMIAHACLAFQNENSDED